MLINEDWTSNLTAFPAALDPWPLLKALDLPNPATASVG
jgi:hypothetical protein